MSASSDPSGLDPATRTDADIRNNAERMDEMVAYRHDGVCDALCHATCWAYDDIRGLLAEVQRLRGQVAAVEALAQFWPPTSFNNEADRYGEGWADGAWATVRVFHDRIAAALGGQQ